MAKIKQCKHCGSETHTSLSCFNAPRKPIKRSVARPIVKKAKTPTKKKPKAKTRSYYVKQLDKVFSLYIRQSKSNEDGMGTCVTCGKYDYWGLLQNGHYYSRGKYPTRWHEDNCHIQCMRCNVMMKGNYTSYALYMFSKYGEDKVMELHKLAHSGEKIPTSVIKEKIEEYKQKLFT